MPPKSREKAAPTRSRKQATAESVPLPTWPSLSPLVPTSALTIETLLQDQVSVIRNFFTSNLCKKYISFLSTLPLITTPSQPKEGDVLRVNDRIQFDDPGFAQQLWMSTGLKSLVSGTISSDSEDSDRTSQASDHEERNKVWGGEVCGLNPRIRIYRYGNSCIRYPLHLSYIENMTGPGQFFGQHCTYEVSQHLLVSQTLCYILYYYSSSSSLSYLHPSILIFHGA